MDNKGKPYEIVSSMTPVLRLKSTGEITKDQINRIINNITRWIVIISYNVSLTWTAVTDLALAAPQVAQGGREGAEEHRVRSGDTLPVCFPQMWQKHGNDVCCYCRGQSWCWWIVHRHNGTNNGQKEEKLPPGRHPAFTTTNINRHCGS